MSAEKGRQFERALGNSKGEQRAYAAKRGGILAVPKRNEKPHEACLRVQAAHPGVKIFEDPLVGGNDAPTLNKKRDFGGYNGPIAPYGTGLHEMSVPEVINFAAIGESGGHIAESTIGDMPVEYRLPPYAIKKRLENGMLNLGFSIYGNYRGNIKYQADCGRLWLSEFDLAMSHPASDGWDGVDFGLAPAFAGIGGRLVDKEIINSLNSLTRYYTGGERQFKPSGVLSGAISHLSKRMFHPFRLLCRMASMYYAAYLLESSGRELRIISLDDGARLTTVNAIGGLTEMATAAYRYEKQPIFFEVPSEVREEDKFAAILQLAGGNKMSMGASTGHMPAIINFWPEIPNTEVYLGNIDRADAKAIRELTSDDIMDTLQILCRQWGVMDLGIEALKTVAFFALRAERTPALLGSSAAVLPLPESDLTPLGMGPIAASFEKFEMHSPVYIEKTAEEFLYEGAIRYMLFSCSVSNTVYESGGAIYQEPSLVMPGVHIGMRKWLEYRSALSGMGAAGEHSGTELGWENLMGRSLSSIGLPHSLTKNRGNILELVCGSNLMQWEEAIPFIRACGLSSGLMPLMRPCHMKSSIMLDTWYSAESIEGRRGISDAYYSLLQLADGVKIGNAAYSNQTGMWSTSRVEVRKNYRGVPADSQFWPMSFDGGCLMPLFKIESAPEMLRAAYGYEERSALKWHYSWDSSTAVEGTVANWINSPAARPLSFTFPKERMEAKTGPSYSIKKEDIPTIGKEAKIPGIHVAAETELDDWDMMADPNAATLITGARNALLAIQQGTPARQAFPPWEKPSRDLSELEILEILPEVGQESRMATLRIVKDACGKMLALETRPTVTRALEFQIEKINNIMGALQICPALSRDELEAWKPGMKYPMGVDWENSMKSMVSRGIPLSEVIEVEKPSKEVLASMTGDVEEALAKSGFQLGEEKTSSPDTGPPVEEGGTTPQLEAESSTAKGTPGETTSEPVGGMEPPAPDVPTVVEQQDVGETSPPFQTQQFQAPEEPE
jgi:hypothetical protein